MAIRRLDPVADAAAVRDFLARASDYILLETGEPPDAATLRDFFEAVPPGGDLAASAKLGLFEQGTLAAIADLGFGFPEPQDAYIGLLLVDPARRGGGLGAAMLADIQRLARDRGAPRLYAAVLDANPRGRAFWERHGFRRVLSTPPMARGRRMHVIHRLVWVSPG
ncbi:MAG: GNAT family N-acetyltransferase [Amaricoccus sp.]